MRCLGGERRGVHLETGRNYNIILQRVDGNVAANSATFLELYEYPALATVTYRVQICKPITVNL